MKQQRETVILPKKEGNMKSVPNYTPKTDRGIFCSKLIEPRRESKKPTTQG